MTVDKKRTAPPKVFQGNSSVRRRVFWIFVSLSLIVSLVWAADFYNRVYHLSGLSQQDRQGGEQ